MGISSSDIHHVLFTTIVLFAWRCQSCPS